MTDAYPTHEFRKVLAGREASHIVEVPAEEWSLVLTPSLEISEGRLYLLRE